MGRPKDALLDALAWLLIAATIALPVMIFVIIVRMFVWAVTGS